MQNILGNDREIVDEEFRQFCLRLQIENLPIHPRLEFHYTQMRWGMNRYLCGLLTAFLGLFAVSAQALEVSGVKYDQTIELAGSKLQLNGAGTRYKAIFKVYTAGLYLGKKVTTPAEVLALGGAKRLSLTMVREIDAEELGRLFIRGIKANATNDEYGQILNSVLRMSQIFYDYKRIKVGEVITMDWVPGTGTVIQIRGTSVGAPFVEPEFYAALLRIWLGTDPADWQLKDALLGIAAK
jgi:hypothetical protein